MLLELAVWYNVSGKLSYLCQERVAWLQSMFSLKSSVLQSSHIKCRNWLAIQQLRTVHVRTKKTISRIIPKHGLQETAKIQGKSWIYETRYMPKHNPLICTWWWKAKSIKKCHHKTSKAKFLTGQGMASFCNKKLQELCTCNIV